MFILAPSIAAGDGSMSFEEKYKIWRESIEEQLNSRYSWVMGNDSLRAELGREVANNLQFIQQKLAEDVYCTIVLEESEFFSELSEKLEGVGLQERQKIWLRWIRTKK